MKISVIIPTYNAQNYLVKLLDQLKHQAVNNFELIIIDSSSKDNTVEIAKQYTDNIFIIPPSEFDHGGTRSNAAKIANGDILIFFTQDALPYDEYCLKNILELFNDVDLSAAYGRQLSYPETNLFGKHLREFNYPDKTEIRSLQDISKYGIKTAQLSNSFAAYRKSHLLKIGNFKDGLILGEDVYVGAKLILAGYKIAYVGNAKVYHSHSYTIWQEFKRYFDIGVFHQCEKWIIEKFGKAEGEGKKYIKSEFKYLLDNYAWYLLPEWFIRNVMKYLGYKLGRNYQKLPKSLILKLSMHYRWCNK
ncbi:glycosyl transferase family protein [Actinobacillus pleuropneumoniae]|uniref:glycosyltransferase family 2 protein n=1 Tax=Actinobacillus pleuropneumoniae TaxID=715 RepID=UPI0001E4A42F|nr:glycosyltransferase family 2 protein [Actinobacillus pleuropneumoniae]EFM89336.1 Glycosyl transferase family 2 [Actinobacillus pleuropneumoniae serovar 4 str. M62]UKH41685.1 glycosyltransferase [Actinobacillus pleuropneumoniae serovar 4 str. M62]SQF65260.1 glycosyl transferase family protein [Actinobacillus pleuropneumoniae]